MSATKNQQSVSNVCNTESASSLTENVSENDIETPENQDQSHKKLVQLTKDAINKIIENDPLFTDLPPDVTIEEIKAQIAVAQGQAITLYLKRGELPTLPIVVSPHNTSVLALKKAIRRQTDLWLRRKNIRKKISWKHVWKKYHLCFQETLLSDDNENIRSYGIANKAELSYVKRRREKNNFRNR